MNNQPPPQNFGMGEPIAIVGIGCIFPKAPDLNAYWRNIKTSQDAITEVPESHWKPEDYFNPDPSAPDMTYARRGGFLDPVDFSPLHYGISPNTLEAIDTTQLLALVATEQALADADYSVRQDSDSGRSFERSRTSVILGVTGALELVIPLGARLGHPRWRKAMIEAGIPAETTEEIISRIAGGYVPWQEQSFPGLLGNVAAGRIANRLDLGGANCVVDAACASSISAIHMAVMELTLGRCDMAISGGIDTFNDIFMYMCFSKTPALSASGDARPFSADADGTMLGEGVGVLILKRLSDARRDGDRIRAVIKGIGASSDGAGNAIYAPSSSGQARALRSAYREANVKPQTIELVEAHGTGTRVGDQVEADALSSVFREDLQEHASVDAYSDKTGNSLSWCALGSVKSMIGHTKAAAGVAGIIKTVMALEHKVLPPTLKVSQPLDSLVPGRSPVYLNITSRPWVTPSTHPRRAGVSAFGFGGSNFHCVLEEAQKTKRVPDWNGNLQLVAFSSQTSESLNEQLTDFQQAIKRSTGRRWDKVRRLAKQSREHFSPAAHRRLVFLLREEQLDQESLFDQIQSLSFQGQSPVISSQSFYGEGKPSSRLGFVFPGQGSQRTNMLKDLSCLFPCMLARWDQVNQVLDSVHSANKMRISDYVYPLPAFDADQIRMQREALQSTCIAQPALAAASLGMLDILSDFGLRAEAFAGHSFGEFTALYAGGVISDEVLLRLARHRGECMEESCQQSQGGMLAINTGLNKVESILQDESLALAIANVNSPSQLVLSGASAELERAREVFNAHGLHSVPLNVAGAFHSPLMEKAREQFAIKLENTEFQVSCHPVYSNVSAARYPQESAGIRSLLSSQITSSVRFVDMIRCMYHEGIHTFVEVGPGKVLQTLIGAILKDHPHQVVALDASCGSSLDLEDLGKVLAQLAAAGHDIDLPQWDPAPPPVSELSGFSLKISGANHFEEKEMPALQYPLGSEDIRPETIGSPSSTETTAASASVLPEPTHSESNIELIQSSLLALQNMQRETSELHRQYLESQQSAQRSIELLLRQQLRVPSEEPAVSETSAPTPPVLTPRSETVCSKPRNAPPESLPASPSTLPAPQAPHPATIESARNSILDVVAEKTGYPRNVLTPTMSLDKDLGIDSIKRVEIFSALAEIFPSLSSLPAAEANSLETLEQIEALLIAGSTHEKAIPAIISREGAKIDPNPVGNTQEHPNNAAAIFSVIADKTGYPTEALNPSLRMDEDLGIDSIKRVEIFSAIQERFPHAPIGEPETLVRLRSIGDLIAHLGNGSVPPNNGNLKTNGNNSVNDSEQKPARKVEDLPPSLSQGSLPVGPGNLDSGLHRLVLKRTFSALEKRRPLPMPSNAVIGILADGTDLGEALRQSFHKHGIVSKLIPTNQKQAVEGVTGLLVVSPDRVEVDTLTNVFSVIREYSGQLQQAATQGLALLASVSRLDGHFGLDSCPIAQPLSAGLGGIFKTAAREWPQVHCKCIDIPGDWKTNQELAEAIVAETLLEGPLEVGLGVPGGMTLELAPEPLPATDSGDGPLIHPQDLVLISGGARGISAAMAIALARRYQPTLLLLGRSPEPQTEADWLQGVYGERAIKQAIHQFHKEGTSPKEIQRLYQQIMANREMLETLSVIQASGSKVLYRSVDIRHRKDTIQAIKEVISQHGPLRGVIHGAGILADSLIADKTDLQFENVLSTKCDGFANVLGCLEGKDPAFIVACSSITARLGRRGQADYAAANECLNKMTQEVAKQYRNSKVLSVNWGPWDGGMVDDRLKAVFKKEGVGLIPLNTGAEYLLQELQSRPTPEVELVVLGPPPQESVSANPTSSPQLCYSQEVSVDSMPILGAHVFNDRAVVPVALVIEWLAHGALHASPGLRFVGLENFKVFKGITLDASQTVKIRVLADLPTCVATDRGRREMVVVEVRSDDMLHAQGTILLGEDYLTVSDSQLSIHRLPYSSQPYNGSWLFHGTELQGLTCINGCDDQGISGKSLPAPEPGAWLKNPLRSQWLADPLVLDASFQMMILWSEHVYGQGSLPTAIGRLELFAPFPPTSVAIDAELQNHQNHKATANIDFRDGQGCLIARIEGYECVIDISLNTKFARNSLSSHS